MIITTNEGRRRLFIKSRKRGERGRGRRRRRRGSGTLFQFSVPFLLVVVVGGCLYVNKDAKKRGVGEEGREEPG